MKIGYLAGACAITLALTACGGGGDTATPAPAKGSGGDAAPPAPKSSGVAAPAEDTRDSQESARLVESFVPHSFDAEGAELKYLGVASLEGAPGPDEGQRIRISYTQNGEMLPPSDTNDKSCQLPPDMQDFALGKKLHLELYGEGEYTAVIDVSEGVVTEGLFEGWKYPCIITAHFGVPGASESIPTDGELAGRDFSGITTESGRRYGISHTDSDSCEVGKNPCEIKMWQNRSYTERP